MEESWVLIDANSGLHVGWYFWLRVLDEVNRAARYGAPFALLLLDAEVPAGKPPKLLDEAPSYVPSAIRSTDLGGALGRGSAAVLLTHQDGQAAEVARARCFCYLDGGGKIANVLTGGWELRRQAELDARRPA